MGNISSYFYFTQCIRIGRQNREAANRKRKTLNSQWLIDIDSDGLCPQDDGLCPQDDSDFDGDDEKIIFYRPRKKKYHTHP